MAIMLVNKKENAKLWCLTVPNCLTPTYRAEFMNFINNCVSCIMPYLEKKRGISLHALIKPMEHTDFKQIKSSGQFEFDWGREATNEVFKIYLSENEKDVLGLMSVINVPREYRIHLNLIEVQSKNRGKDKQINRIAGCLIAFACELAFARGYFGFVSLQPKSKLIRLYQEKYGFRQYGQLLGVEQASAYFLIEKYLNDENK